MGMIWSFIDEGWPPASHFSYDDIPDLSDKVVLVTGGNSGVGRVTIKALLNHNAKVYLAARSRSKAEEAIADLKEETGKEAIFLEADLANLSTIRRSAEELLRKETKLDALFNNAGVMIPPVEELTSDGYDLQFGTNVLGHFFLTKLLMPALIEGASRSPSGKARIITTSSVAHLGAFGLNFETFRDTPERRKLGTYLLYAQSKLADIMLAREFAKRYGDKGIVSIACNPGILKTNLMRSLSNVMRRLTFMIFCHPVDPNGALTQLWAGTSPETEEFNGKYVVPWARLGQPSKYSYDNEQCEKLWDWLVDQVKDL